MKSRLFLFTAIIFAVSAITAISFAQRRPDPERPITGDFKITIRTNMTGQDMQSTTTSPTVQSSASGKEDSQEASISAALEGEARAAAAAVPRM